MMSSAIFSAKKSPCNRRWRIHAGLLLMLLILSAVGGAPQAFSADPLLQPQVASQVGLQRAWFSQVRVDRARSRVISWTLDNEQLFALTSAGAIDAIDAKSGRTLWVSDAGRPDRPSAGLAAGAAHVALVNGSILYVLDRSDGHLLWTREIGNVALAAPGVGGDFVFIAQMSGRVEGFSLEDPKLHAWQYQSTGHIFQPPRISGEFFSWSTDRGQLYFGVATGPKVLLRVETDDEIVSAPSVHGKKLFATSLGGYLYCFDLASGDELWRFSAGLPIVSPPTAIDNRVYVATESHVLYAIDSAEGRQIWSSAGVAQFVAQGAQHVYGLDQFGTLLILDSATGKVVNRISADERFSAVVNDQSDRLYLVSESGLIQCFHEIGASEPTLQAQTQDQEPAKEDKEDDDDGKSLETPAGKNTEEPAGEDNFF